MAPSVTATAHNDDSVIVSARKRLIEETKKFKQLDDQSKIAELPDLLKLYHQEIDALVVRCKDQTVTINKLQERVIEDQRAEEQLGQLVMEKEQVAIQLARAQYDLDTANMLLEEKQRRIEEFEGGLFSSSPVIIASDSDDFKQLKAEYDKAIDQIYHLQNEIKENEQRIASLQVSKHAEKNAAEIKGLQEMIHRLESKLEDDRNRYKRELQDGIAKERSKWEQSVAISKKDPKDNQELELLRQQLSVERREKSRLEADNVILVERLRQNVKRKNSASPNVPSII